MNSGTCIEHRINKIDTKNHHNQKHRISGINDNSNNNNNNNNETIQSQLNHNKNDTFSVENFYKLMRFERLRLITFILYDHQWPKMDIISPVSLANVGFFYYKNDTVCCAFCRGKIRNWEKDDDAMNEHKNHFPNCPFVQNKPVGNVPIESDPDINCKKTSTPLSTSYVDKEPTQEPIKNNYNKSMNPKFIKFNDKKIRQISFTHPNWPKNGKPTIDSFVNAGFFYIGKEDCTRCYHCGGNLCNWKSDENPMEEHALFFPECPYIITINGPNYLEFVKFKNQIIKMRSKMNTSYETKAYDINCLRKITFENFLTMQDAARRILGRLCKKKYIQKTYEEYLEKFFFFLDFNRLFYHFSEMNIIKKSNINEFNDINNNDDNNYNYNNNNLSDNDDDCRHQQQMNILSSKIFCLAESSDSDYSSSNSDCEDSFSSPKFDSQTSSSISLRNNKNNNTLSSLICIICCDKKIQVVFLPCGHQVACMKCSSQLNTCPICRKIITDKIRTYFAHID